MVDLKKLMALSIIISLNLIFIDVAIPSSILTSNKVNIENQKISAVIEKFEKISSIPRCPGEEKNLAYMLKKWSQTNRLKYKKDSKGNVLIKVPATKGFENAPIIVLQGHMDMVCEKTSGSTHNFKKDPIKLIYDGDWLSAQGTTLGADNGIGIALCMALVEDKDISHPPLELLFTVEEEIGLKGAAKLKPGFIKGRIFINVDSEGEGVLTIGSAGGAGTLITLNTSKNKLPKKFDVFNLQISGLQGGHSGGDIHKNRGNAIKVLAGAMDMLSNISQIRLVTFKGGSKANAIPRYAMASLAFNNGMFEKLTKIIAEYEQKIKNKYALTEKDVSINLVKNSKKKISRAITWKDTQKIIKLLNTLPNGVSSFSSEFEGSVEMSNNIGIAYLKNDTFVVISLSRSADMLKIKKLQSQIRSAANKLGARAKIVNQYAAWRPNKNSSLLQRSQGVYQETFGERPYIAVVHGGLECSVIAAKIPGVDMIAIGPTIENAHSPNERLYIPSIEKLWKFLGALLNSYEIKP